MDHCYFDALTTAIAVFEPEADLRRHLEALRVRDGEPIRLFNGKGLVATGRVERSDRLVRVHIVEHHHVPEPVPLILALGGLDHRDRLEFAVEKAVELGATRFVPLDSDHVQRHRSQPERLHAKAVAALTQSGNAWLPQIDAPMTLEDLLQTLPPASRVLVGDAGGRSPVADDVGGPVCCVVGPEGGFSEREIALLTADPRTLLIAIGRLRLRAETAAVAMLSVCSALRQDPT